MVRTRSVRRRKRARSFRAFVSLCAVLCSMTWNYCSSAAVASDVGVLKERARETNANRRQEDLERLRRERRERHLRQHQRRFGAVASERGSLQTQTTQTTQTQTRGNSELAAAADADADDLNNNDNRNNEAVDSKREEGGDSNDDDSAATAFVVEKSSRSTSVTKTSRNWPVLNPENEKCVHGYTSIVDMETCVCNTDWEGDKCDIDPTPSCDRFTHGSCGDILVRAQINFEWPGSIGERDFPSCQCVDECIEHDYKTFGEHTYEVMLRDDRRFQFLLKTEHFCKAQHDDADDDNTKKKDFDANAVYLRSFIQITDNQTRIKMRLKNGNVNKESHEDFRFFEKVRSNIIAVEDHGKNLEKHHEQNRGHCSPQCEQFGKCEWFECACEKGRFGYECALSEDEVITAKVSAEKRYSMNELSLAAADLPGGVKRWYRGAEYKSGGSYRGVHYFFESMIADVGVIDPNTHSTENTLVVPFFPGDLVGNVGGFSTLMERAMAYVDKKYTLHSSKLHTTVWLNAMDRSLCTMSEDIHSELPPGAIVVSQYGMWRQRTNMPLCFDPDKDVVIPSSLSSPEGYAGEKDVEHKRFDPSTKNGLLLFFRGRTKDFAQCKKDKLFENIQDCMYLYSGGMRTWMTDWYQDEKRFFLNKDPMLPEYSEYGNVKDPDTGRIGGDGSEIRATNIRMRSYFCLASGGNGWDQRFFDSIHRGCVPLMTQLNTSHPFDFILDYDQFTVYIPSGSEDLKRVPEILASLIQNGRHAQMVKNCRIAHEAFAWGSTFRNENKERDTFLVLNGAYYHTVWAIALRTKKELPKTVAKELCKLYYNNPWHESAYEVLYPEAQEHLKKRC